MPRKVRKDQPRLLPGAPHHGTRPRGHEEVRGGAGPVQGGHKPKLGRAGRQLLRRGDAAPAGPVPRGAEAGSNPRGRTPVQMPRTLPPPPPGRESKPDPNAYAVLGTIHYSMGMPACRLRWPQ